MNLFLKYLATGLFVLFSPFLYGNEWYVERMKRLDSIQELTVDQQMEYTGSLIGSLGTRKQMQEYHKEVFERAQKHLLSIPGHAEYYAKQIDEARKKVDVQDPAQGRAALSTSNRIQSWSFQTLAQLPSPETVRVLGEFLQDERGTYEPDPDNLPPSFEEAFLHHPICNGAAKALGVLIENPPVDMDGPFLAQRQLPPWRLWYEQVKAGTRTYRFKGDPQEYDLNGPVREARVPNAGQQTRGRGERVTQEAAPGKQEGVSVATVMAILAACGLCGGALWYAKRGKG